MSLSKPIRLLVISNYRDFHTARPEAQLFKSLAKMGFEITILTYEDSKHVSAFREVGIKVINFHPEKKFDTGEIDFIKKTLVDLKIDIMYLFNSKSIVNGIRAAKGLTVKVVLYRGYSANINWMDPTAYIKYLHPRVDKIICNSVGVEEMFLRQRFLNKSKVVTINKGHDLSWYDDYEPLDIRSELGISKEALLLINVSNNRRMKGIPYLLEAMNQLPKEYDIHLMIAGRDMDIKPNMNVINEGDKQDRIHLLGFRKDVLNIVAASDAFVLPSIKGESITKSVIEAMSLSITPVISDIAGNRELVVNQESGIVFPSKNIASIKSAIIQLYKNRHLCKQFGEQAKQRVNTHLHFQQTAEQTKIVFEELMMQ